jgi:hypothetical protein
MPALFNTFQLWKRIFKLILFVKIPRVEACLLLDPRSRRGISDYTEMPGKSTLEPLNSLSVAEARRLLTMMALEESGLAPSGRDECHCCHRTHKHKKGGNTASLSIKPLKKPEENNPTPDDTKVGRIQCRGSCGYEHLLEAEARKNKTQAWKLNTLAFYLEGISPDPANPGSWKDFWTADKVATVLSALKKKEKFTLGWLAHKLSRGIPAAPGAKDSSEIGHSERIGSAGAQKSPNGFLCEWTEIFGDALECFDKNPACGKTVAAARGWNSAVLRELIKDQLLSIKPSDRHEGDYVLAFAYKGLVPGPASLPCRLIKTRHLFATPETDAFSRRTIHPGTFSALLGDFTTSNEIIQNAKRVVFVEGEPDAISWRHIFPSDGIVCVGDVNEYKPILECLPGLSLKGKDIVYVQDRDQDSSGRPKITAEGFESHHEVLSAIAGQKPSTIKLWICPQSPGGEMKDPNDFLKKSSKPADILKYASTLYSPSERLSLPRYKKTFGELFSQELLVT